MNREEYFRNSCGITAKNMIPYIRTMDKKADKPPRISTADRKKIVILPPIAFKPSADASTPRISTADRKKIVILPPIAFKPSKPKKPKDKIAPRLNLDNLITEPDYYDKMLFDNLRDRERRLLRIANSKTIQDAIKENNEFNRNYISKL